MIEIAVLGCGVVGSGVCRLIEQNAEDIEKRLGERIVVKKVMERVPERACALGFSDDQICENFEDILADDGIRIVVETLGGTVMSFQCDMAALAAGRHVVTSNKDLVELRWTDLYGCASQNGVGLYYEGAVCGAIPVIQSIKSSLAANRIDRIVGILNGTSNYILTKMYHEELDYESALARAQQHGFAERDPSADVGGYDAARKLAILSRQAFHCQLSLKDIYVEGITDIGRADIETARELGYVVKLIAVSERMEHGVAAAVRPAFVPLGHPVAGVNREYNAVLLSCDAAGDIMLYGKGAGSMPTASAIAGDVIMAARGELETRKRKPAPICYENLPVLHVEDMQNSYYLHMNVRDKPLVLAGISTALGKWGVSMASLVQRPQDDGTATLIIITHPARERDLRGAIKELRADKAVGSVKTLMCLAQQEGA